MRKRIRLHQVRIGMFIEELEGLDDGSMKRSPAFLISSVADVERVLHSRAMSAVINVKKGLGAVGRPPSAAVAFEAGLQARFSEEEIRQARQTIEDTTPNIRQMLTEARTGGIVQIEAAVTAVEQIMATALDNAGALISITKLKQRDNATFLHSLAVSALMISFGRIIGLKEDNVRLLGIGGLVHDLGKMALPLDVLNKPGKLGPEEFAVIRSHPQRGYEMLRQIEGLPPAVLDICLYHHEKFDGSGYPHSLRGHDIPFTARLAAICDVYDALTTIRPYKQVWTQAQAVDCMLCSQGHFDPPLLAQFVSSMVVTGRLH